MKKVLLLIAVFALAVASCGGGDDTATGDLPINTGDEPTGIDSACLVGDPDCQDIPGETTEPQDLPGDDDVVVGDGMAVDGGLTVADALAGNADGILAVKGYVVASGDGIRLCDALAESFPPQCGGDSVLLDSLDSIDPDELTSEGDVTWTGAQQTVYGELSDGTLTTTSQSQ
jgi:hypothetical protein